MSLTPSSGSQGQTIHVKVSVQWHQSMKAYVNMLKVKIVKYYSWHCFMFKLLIYTAFYNNVKKKHELDKNMKIEAKNRHYYACLIFTLV